jgi:hypothetical protein
MHSQHHSRKIASPHAEILKDPKVCIPLPSLFRMLYIALHYSVLLYLGLYDSASLTLPSTSPRATRLGDTRLCRGMKRRAGW